MVVLDANISVVSNEFSQSFHEVVALPISVSHDVAIVTTTPWLTVINTY